MLRNQLRLRQAYGNPETRVYLALRNAGPLHGNKATRQRRLRGFQAMNTVRIALPSLQLIETALGRSGYHFY